MEHRCKEQGRGQGSPVTSDVRCFSLSCTLGPLLFTHNFFSVSPLALGLLTSLFVLEKKTKENLPLDWGGTTASPPPTPTHASLTGSRETKQHVGKKAGDGEPSCLVHAPFYFSHHPKEELGTSCLGVKFALVS